MMMMMMMMSISIIIIVIIIIILLTMMMTAMMMKIVITLLTITMVLMPRQSRTPLAQHSCRDTLVGQCCGLVQGESCRILFRDTFVGQCCVTLLWDTLMGHSRGAILWGRLVGYSCKTPLLDICARALLWDTLVGHSAGASPLIPLTSNTPCLHTRASFPPMARTRTNALSTKPVAIRMPQRHCGHNLATARATD